MSDMNVPTAPVHLRQGSSIGQPLTRRDGVLKVTGQAVFAADNHPDGMLHAVMAVSSIARGRVVAFDLAAARAHPGVVEVMTPGTAPPWRRTRMPSCTRSCSAWTCCRTIVCATRISRSRW